MASFFRQIMFFSSRQKKGLLALLLLIVVLIAANIILPKLLKKPNNSSQNKEFMAKVERFRSSLQEREKKSYRNANFTPYDYNSKDFSQQLKDEKHQLFDFDPNTADSLTLSSLGLRNYVVRNILNYRRKGGKFRSDEDFGKIYGLSENDFLRLKPYISIAKKAGEELKTYTRDTLQKNSERIHEKKNLDITVELNTADTAELKQLTGIGSYFARQIVYYRDKLGGYHSVEQLLEIKNFTPEKLDRIRQNLTIDKSKIRQIAVNWATVEKLDRHPYINFYQAKAIFEKRKKREFSSIDDLKGIPQLTEKDLERIAPYLKFGKGKD